MTKFEIRPFGQDDLDPIVELINRAIAGRRGAALVRREEFRSRVLDHPGFDPLSMLLALDGGQVVGAVHAIVPPVEIPNYRPLEGQGFIVGPYVQGAARHTGIGQALLAEAETYLAGRCCLVWAHGLRAPFYHALEGPRQPYCGSSEIIGLTHDDAGLLSFLYAAGYREGDEQELSMVARLLPFDELSPIPPGLELVRVSSRQPWMGPVQWSAVESGYGYVRFGDFEYDSLGVAQGDVLVGHCQWYPMRRAGRVALYDLRLDLSLRGMGLGKLLVERGLDSMWKAGYREVELHTSPQRNSVAYRIYQRYGFRAVQEWLPLRKDISI